MNICVIGAGTMGSGIAQVFAENGHAVLLCDQSVEQASAGKGKIEKSLARLKEKGKIDAERMDAVLSAITPGELLMAGDCDWVVEAAFEDLSVKLALFQQLDAICKEETVFCSNTSSISITELDMLCRHELIGLHFFNPAPVMGLIEVIEGLNTKKELTEKAVELAKSLGKTPVLVKDSPGFIVNRVLVPMINEAVFLLYEGVADAEAIDTAMKLGANHPMGPLALSDLIGNDVVLAICNVLYEETLDSKYRPCPLLKKMVRGKLLGRKTGQGFFSYK